MNDLQKLTAWTYWTHSLIGIFSFSRQKVLNKKELGRNDSTRGATVIILFRSEPVKSYIYGCDTDKKYEKENREL